jgi:hypothetical protein
MLLQLERDIDSLLDRIESLSNPKDSIRLLESLIYKAKVSYEEYLEKIKKEKQS